MMTLLDKRRASRALLLAALLAAAPACAKTFTFQATGRATPIELPDDWSVTTIKAGVEAKSGDGEVYVWLQGMDDRNVKTLIEEYFAYYRDQGVRFSGGTTDSKGEIGGVAVSMMDAPATYEGKPTIVRFIFTEAKPGARKGLLVGYWASPKGDKRHEGAVLRMIGDLLRP